MFLKLKRIYRELLKKVQSLPLITATTVVEVMMFSLNQPIRTSSYLNTKEMKIGEIAYLARTKNNIANGMSVVSGETDEFWYVRKISRETSFVVLGDSERPNKKERLFTCRRSDILSAEEYENFLATHKKMNPIEIGSIVTIVDSSPMLYGKVVDITNEDGYEQYIVLLSGYDNSTKKYVREHISEPSNNFSIRGTALKKNILSYEEGDHGQIIGEYLYLGGDDVIIKTAIATKNEII